MKGTLARKSKLNFFTVIQKHKLYPLLISKNKTIVFCADLLPSTGHIPLPYVMSYDVQPLITLKEKENF